MPRSGPVFSTGASGRSPSLVPSSLSFFRPPSAAEKCRESENQNASLLGPRQHFHHPRQPAWTPGSSTPTQGLCALPLRSPSRSARFRRAISGAPTAAGSALRETIASQSEGYVRRIDHLERVLRNRVGRRAEVCGPWKEMVKRKGRGRGGEGQQKKVWRCGRF